MIIAIITTAALATWFIAASASGLSGVNSGARELWQHLERHEMRFFGDIVVGPVGRGLDDVLGHGDIHSLQLGYIYTGLGDGPGRNFSEHVIVIRIILFKYGERTGGAHEVNSSTGRVVDHFIGSAYAVERLHHFPGIGVHDHQPPRFVLVSAFDTAAHEQAMMGGIQTRRMGRSAARNRPL